MVESQQVKYRRIQIVHVDWFFGGIECEVITDLNRPWGESESCTSCGKCVQVCPTGALVDKGTAAGEMQKKGDFLTYLSMMRGNR